MNLHRETQEFIREYRPLFNLHNRELHRYIKTWQAYNRSRPLQLHTESEASPAIPYILNPRPRLVT